MKRIIGKAIGDIDTASSRIRFFNFLNYLPKEFNYAMYAGSLDCDYLFIQKDASSKMIGVVKEAKSKNIPVVYDIDDDIGVWPNMHEKEMLNLVDAVTTSTEELRGKLKTLTKKPIHIVPNGLDYLSSKRVDCNINNNIEKVVTFGNVDSVEKTIKYLNTAGYKYDVSYITDRRNSRLKNFRFIKWELNTFLKNLSYFDLCILNHFDTPYENIKSNNRLTTCVSIGIPTIVSNTMEYKNTMKKMGMDFLIFDDKFHMNNIINSIALKDDREKIKKIFVEHAWKYYHPSLSGKILAKVFMGLK